MEFSSFEDWKEKLKEEGSRENVVVLVEGKKDEDRLKKLGIKNIIPLKGKKFYDILEKVENCSEVILLFDLDKHGEKIFCKFFQILQREGIPVNRDFRDFLKKFNIKEIENIPLEGEPELKKNEVRDAC
ncbi:MULTISPECIES: toprim domain-containing protein [Persephonella]|uniref:Toprim domain protein n=1 Tax=Persephonella marina (strain DSM 14350 / EX-H1) TaxID=123214 RepID=C0QPQ7_PERMH|nr:MULTISPECIES: toprim domain-containing protein [Persephonella]ACO04358.1 toprim domain protein [Persephonella marina EX-H1]